MPTTLHIIFKDFNFEKEQAMAVASDQPVAAPREN